MSTGLRRLVRLLVAIVTAAVLLGACGDDSGRYDDAVAEARAAIEAGDRSSAEAALERIGFEALAAHEAGEIDRAELDEVASLLASTEALLDQLLPTTTTTEPLELDDEDRDEGKGRGNGTEGRDEKNGDDKDDKDDKDDEDD